MEIKSSVIMDTTSLYSVGKVLSADLDGDGGRHARGIYSTYQNPAIVEDVRAFLEFLTAIVLYDEVQWNANSQLQEIF
jgi:hypothetical protein